MCVCVCVCVCVCLCVCMEKENKRFILRTPMTVEVGEVGQPAGDPERSCS